MIGILDERTSFLFIGMLLLLGRMSRYLVIP
jgi:hypothetical protein